MPCCWSARTNCAGGAQRGDDAFGQVIEGASAAGFAALKKLAKDLPGTKTVLILSGGNLPIEDLRALLAP